jgi:hypothetical protein
MYENLIKAELRRNCKDKGLLVSGNRADLIERLSGSSSKRSSSIDDLTKNFSKNVSVKEGDGSSDDESSEDESCEDESCEDESCEDESCEDESCEDESCEDESCEDDDQEPGNLESLHISIADILGNMHTYKSPGKTNAPLKSEHGIYIAFYGNVAVYVGKGKPLSQAVEREHHDKIENCGTILVYYHHYANACEELLLNRFKFRGQNENQHALESRKLLLDSIVRR